MTEDYKQQCEFCLKYYPEEELTTKDCGTWTKICCEGCLKNDSGIEGISEDLTEPEPEPEPVKEKHKIYPQSYKTGHYCYFTDTCSQCLSFHHYRKYAGWQKREHMPMCFPENIERDKQLTLNL